MLDLGASDRALVQIGRKFGLDAVGLDINDINFEKDNFGFKDNQFNLVTAVSLIEHM